MGDVNPKTDQANQVDFVLQDYLDQLLVSATEVAAVTTDTSSPAVSAQVAAADSAADTEITSSEALLSRRAEAHMPTSVRTAFAEAVPLAPIAEISVPEISVPEVALQDRVEKSTETVDTVAEGTDSVNELTGVPQQTLSLNWQSSQGIDCLIFKVAGLKLAIPLPLLGGVHNVTDKVTPLFGQASWSLGVWQGDKAKLTIIDSAQLIMPERRISLNDAGYSFFIQLDRSPWALACQEICDTVTLVHDSIKWRGDGSKRPWLAGTVISEMCALLDVPGLLKLLEENRRAARQP